MSETRRMAAVVASLDWQAEPGHEPFRDSLAEEFRQRLGDGALRWVEGTVHETLSRVHDQLQDSLAPRSQFLALSHHILIDTLLGMTGDSPFPAERRVIGADLAHDFVARGVDTADIVAGMRDMQRHWLAALTEAALAVDADAARLAPTVAASVTTTMDAWVAAMSDAIVERRHQTAQGGEVRTRIAIESLIAGEPVDAAATSALLRVSLAAWHTCCVVGAAAGVIVDRAKVDVTARSLSRWANPALHD